MYLYAKDDGEILSFFCGGGGGAWNVEFYWVIQWTTVGVIGSSSLMHDQHVSSHHCSLHHLTDFELSIDSLIFKKILCNFFFHNFWICCFFTNKRIIYEWIQTIAKKSFRASQYHGKKGDGCLDFFFWEAKLSPVGINWFPVSWDGLVQVLPRQTGYHWGCTNVVVWVMHAARLWLERSLCRVCTFYHTYLSLQSLHI